MGYIGKVIRGGGGAMLASDGSVQCWPVIRIGGAVLASNGRCTLLASD